MSHINQNTISILHAHAIMALSASVFLISNKFEILCIIFEISWIIFAFLSTDARIEFSLNKSLIDCESETMWDISQIDRDAMTREQTSTIPVLVYLMTIAFSATRIVIWSY
jgi:hypothetical protein